MGRPWFTGRDGRRGLRPASPEGWAVTAAFVLAVALFFAVFRPFAEEGNPLLFAVCTIGAVLAYTGIASRHSDRG